MHHGEKIHILVALTDLAGVYTKFVGTMLCSLFANTRHPVTVHILHDHTLQQINRERLQQVAAAFSQTLCFYNMDELAQKQLEQFPLLYQSDFAPAIMYRLLAGDILPTDIQRIIYLDADIIVHLDIAELWQQDINCTLAAVPDFGVQQTGSSLADKGYFTLDRYFNSGVLLMQLNAFRTRPILTDGLRFLQKTGCLEYPDQDILNYFFKQDCVLLPKRFNMLVRAAILHGVNTCAPAIYHYAGHMLSFRADIDIFSQLFYHYFTMTPWCNGHFFIKLMQRIQQAERRQSLTLMREISTRGRAFLCHAEDYAALKAVFGIQPDEPCFLLQNGHVELSLDKLQKRVLFVCVPYKLVYSMLIGAGLQEYRDFLNGCLYWQNSAIDDDERRLETLLTCHSDFPIFCNTL